MPQEPTDDESAIASKQLPPPLVPLLGYLLRRAHNLSIECMESTLPPRHPSQLAVLTAVEALQPASQRLLGERLAINRTIMVQIVDQLEDEGLVTRDRDPKDRRSYAVTLTWKGKRVLADLEPKIEAHTECLTRNLTKAERTRLNRLLVELLQTPEGGLSDVPPKMTKRTGFLVARAHFVLRALAKEPLAPLGIEPQHYATLLLLDQQGPSPQRAIADGLGVSGTVVVQIADHLEAAGMVERRRSSEDRRAYLLTTTRRGAATLRQARQVVESVREEITAPLGPQGGSELESLLTKLLGG